MNCRKCGASLEEAARFCEKCGTPAAEPVEYGYPYLQQVLPGPGMLRAYASMWKNYANFRGRARRREYWLPMLMEFIIQMVVAVVFLLLGGTAAYTGEVEGTGVAALLVMVVFWLYKLAIIIPQLALQTRRLHDTGRSGKLIFASVILMLMYAVCIVAVIVMGPNSLSSISGFSLLGGLCVMAAGVINIVVFVFCCLDGQQLPNRYGYSPKYMSNAPGSAPAYDPFQNYPGGR